MLDIYLVLRKMKVSVSGIITPILNSSLCGGAATLHPSCQSLGCYRLLGIALQIEEQVSFKGSFTPHMASDLQKVRDAVGSVFNPTL